MKKKTLGILLICTLFIAGCSSKSIANTVSNSNTDKKSSSVTSTKTDFKPLKPGTVPQLSQQQKKQVNSTLGSTVKNLDNDLKSLQDPSDIDLSSIN